MTHRAKVKVINETVWRMSDLRSIAVQSVRQVEDLLRGRPRTEEHHRSHIRICADSGGDSCWGRDHLHTRAAIADELAEQKHAHAVAKATEWERKRRAAANREKGWRKKVKYYERRMAALRKED